MKSGSALGVSFLARIVVLPGLRAVELKFGLIAGGWRIRRPVVIVALWRCGLAFCVNRPAREQRRMSGARGTSCGWDRSALWGMSYGLWYAVFAEHQALRDWRSLSPLFGRAQRDVAQSAIASCVTENPSMSMIASRVHSHWIGLAMV